MDQQIRMGHGRVVHATKEEAIRQARCILGWVTVCGRGWVSSVLRPHQHSIGYTGDTFLQVKRPNQNQQYQSTEGDATKEKENNENN